MPSNKTTLFGEDFDTVITKTALELAIKMVPYGTMASNAITRKQEMEQNREYVLETARQFRKLLLEASKDANTTTP